jgi:GT2 family glycosyltransferase/glycosyltransferase involved in cell wall biosynthesis
MTSRDSPSIAQLHVVHDLGGGTATWLREFVAADTVRRNLVVKSIAHGPESGSAIALFDARDFDTPLQVWPFDEPIPAALPRHREYKAALDVIIGTYGVDAVIVSSLIGHSLEVLDTGLPTLVVNHDYFPTCPTVHLYLGEPRDDKAHESSPFRDFPPAVREQVRERFIEAVTRPNITMVVPSPSVRRHLERLDPRFIQARFALVPHGQSRLPASLPPIRRVDRERLRILVLGQLSFVKGCELLRASLPAITRVADVFLVGAGEVGQSFEGLPHVSVTPRYEPHELAGHVSAINPHLGLLASVVCETFSFTLSELLAMGIPVAASRLGSFEDRIRPGIDGFLFEPDAASLTRLLESIDKDSRALDAMRAALRPPSRSASEMVADYHALLPLDGQVRDAIQRPVGPRDAERVDGLIGRQALHMAELWRELKSLHLQLALANQRRESDRADAAAQLKEVRRQVAVGERRIGEASEAIEEKQRANEALRVENQAVHAENARQAAQINAIFHSPGWRVLGVARRTARGIGKLRLLVRCLAGVVRDPRGPRAGIAHVFRAWRAGGVAALKSALVTYEPRDGVAAAWRVYRRTLTRDVLPRLRERMAALRTRPRISIVMATHDTEPRMLREALASVLAQLYPDWELCIVDDGSRSPHVAAILREHAARDARIKVEFSAENRGVAHASNRALSLVTGEYVVLMDHDDRLEEQALLRMAEAFVEDGADIAYSDEVLVAPDGETATEFVYRPAFSPELLRSHPYIVHLVGFRTELIRRLGGFDESLAISQDYDLMLRCSEQAHRVVHVPEILYRWRTHPASAGHKMMDRVMTTSTAIVQRHLERTARDAVAGPGFGFNFFESRRALRPELRVAIIIPTRNQVKLLRSCVESLHRTIGEVPFDVFVVDHESDDAATLEFLDASRLITRVLRYEGPFNFSAINNRAVRELGNGYSHYLFCNNDIEAIEAGWLERMLEVGQERDVGIVGAKLFYSDGVTIQHAGVGVGLFGIAEHYGKFLRMPRGEVVPGNYGMFHVTREVSAVTAACMLVRCDVFEQVGGFDESLAVGFGDVDLCLRVLASGYRVLHCAGAALVHHESATRGPNNSHPADSAFFQRRWSEWLAAGDPYYSPGFSITSTSWQTKQPLHASVQPLRRTIEMDPVKGRQAVRVGPARAELASQPSRAALQGVR